MSTSVTLPLGESLTIEFKSDRVRLSDDDLIEALVCLANADGGELWLGVEDDGKPTGLHMAHQNLIGLPALVAAKTSPSLSVVAEVVTVEGVSVGHITVPRSSTVIATTAGVYVRRRLKHDGKPECVPMLPHEHISHASNFGLIDVSAQPVAGSTLADFDPLERERLRQAVQQYGGDRVLLELDDEALDGALGFTTHTSAGERVPTLTGLLVIGRQSALRARVPTHELAFQVLANEDVPFNDFVRFPLLKALDWLDTNFRPYNPEREVQIGLFRVPIPKVDRGAFREAVANALVHRDYHRLGAVHALLDDQGLTVSNPGGLVEGVTLSNLLTTVPRPRNPVLADAMKRIGIVERSGRGVDKIYRGMLRFGRPQPNYGRTSRHNVILEMTTGQANKEFLRLVIEHENQQDGDALPIDSLIALAVLSEEKRLSADALAHHIHRDATSARRTLERLFEAGLVQPHGNTRARTYTLSRAIYQSKGEQIAYTRQVGLSNLQHEQLVLNHAQLHDAIKRSDVIELCNLSPDQAAKLLTRLKTEGKLAKHGNKRGSFYTLMSQL